MVNGEMVVDVVNAHDVHLVYFNSQFVRMYKMYTLTAVLHVHWYDYLDRDGLRVNLQSCLKRRVMDYCLV